MFKKTHIFYYIILFYVGSKGIFYYTIEGGKKRPFNIDNSANPMQSK
jgi:hypothetical protein